MAKSVMDVWSGGATDALRVAVNQERCVGCQECVIRCPEGALSLDTDAWKAQADDALCVGCRQCERTCPYGAIEVHGAPRVAERIELDQPTRPDLAGDTSPVRRGLTREEARYEAERCLHCPDPTCVLACPAHNDIPAFIEAVREGNLERAHEVLRQTSVLPDVCSRVCDQSTQCEGACSWALAGERPVAIGLLERFVTDEHAVPAPVPASSEVRADVGTRVAVIGSGPAGLAAASELLQGGAAVTMFEKDDEPGGVLAWGIPSFTLPDSVVRRPVQALIEAGLDLNTGVEIGPADIAGLARTFDAVLLANGASLPMMLRTEGADLEGVEDATSFLRRGKRALQRGGRLEDVGPGSRLLVVGAGNTAMDVARTARRLGAEALAVDWMDRRFARVRADELDEAEEEGVAVRFSVSVARLEGENGHVVAAHLASTVQKSATSLPKVLSEEPERWPVDHVVMAMGYRVESLLGDAGAKAESRPRSGWRAGRRTNRSGSAHGTHEGTHLPIKPPHVWDRVPNRRWMASGLLAGRNGVATLALEREAVLERSREPFLDRIWVVGDALVGPSTVVGAMAQGREAARQILTRRAELNARPGE